jgi:hypothetical protein
MPVLRLGIIVAFCATTIATAAIVRAQSAQPDSQVKTGAGLSPNEEKAGGGNPDAALEITPRSGTSVAPADNSANSSSSDSGDLTGPPEQELPALPTSGPPTSMLAYGAPPRPNLPYLGISVQQIESHSTPGRDVEGLEIVSIDPDSPAERAGLKGRGAMTKLGASGATAGALMAPLDIALMPLLKKTGQLGQTGDLIVAIDDRRVAGEVDLQTALADSKPGDTIYLTVVRLGGDGARKTLKIPVRLANPVSAP